MKAKTSTERSAARVEKQKGLGYLGRKVWATEEEHIWLNQQLDKRRGVTVLSVFHCYEDAKLTVGIPAIVNVTRARFRAAVITRDKLKVIYWLGRACKRATVPQRQMDDCYEDSYK